MVFLGTVSKGTKVHTYTHPLGTYIQYNTYNEIEIEKKAGTDLTGECECVCVCVCGSMTWTTTPCGGPGDNLHPAD